MFSKIAKFAALASVVLCSSAWAIDPDALCHEDYWDDWKDHGDVTIVATSFNYYPSVPQVCFNCWAYKPHPTLPGGIQGLANASTCPPIITPEEPPSCDKTGVAGNPVRLSDGAKYEVVQDIAPPSTLSRLGWGRTYNSAWGEWRFDHPVNYSNDDQPVATYHEGTMFDWVFATLTLPDKNKIYWFRTPGGEPQIMSSSNRYFLQGIPTNDVTINNPETGETYVYDLSGKLKVITYYNGQFLNFSYDGNKLRSIIDHLGHQLRFYFHEENEKLQFVESSWGIVVHYTYDTAGRLIQFGKGADINQAPAAFSYVTYLYEDENFPNALTGVVDENNVRYATWTYDSLGRAKESYHGDHKDYVSVSYYGNDRTVTNGFNKSTTYEFINTKAGKRIKRIHGAPTPKCALTNQYQSLFSNGEVQTKTDSKGNVTLYKRDSLGRVTRKTEGLRWPGNTWSGIGVNTDMLVPPTNPADLRVVDTCWHATIPKPVRVIEATRVTLFEYNITGDLINTVIKPRPPGEVDCSTIIGSSE